MELKDIEEALKLHLDAAAHALRSEASAAPDEAPDVADLKVVLAATKQRLARLKGEKEVAIRRYDDQVARLEEKLEALGGGKRQPPEKGGSGVRAKPSGVARKGAPRQR